MNNKEHLLYFFLSGTISLSQYDYKFMSNLQTMISNDSRVTTNQATLFDNLISKYQKQLSKAGYDKQTLKALPWKTSVIESTAEHTGARVSLFDNELKIRVPFNKSFIAHFRENVVDNPFDWDKESKYYRAYFTTNALKIAVKSLPKYFPTVTYHDDLVDIMNELKKYEAPVWDPTLINNNGHLMIAATNHIIDNIVKDINLQLNMKTLHTLSRHGIKTDTKITDTDPKLKFAAEYVTEVDLDDMEQVAAWVKELDCDGVILGRGIIYGKTNGLGETATMKETITTNLAKHNVPCIASHSSHEGATVNRNYLLMQLTSIITTPAVPSNTSKIIIVKNSRPIEVK